MQISRDVLRAALALPTHAAFGVDRAVTADAAVAIPIRLEPTPTATLVLRSRALRDHAGEVGFPGGKVEPSDADLAATALREMEEEVALRAADVELLGGLSPVPVITRRYLIHPFVVLVRPGAAPRAASTEIARLLDVPLLPWMTGDEVIRGVQRVGRDGEMLAPHFELDRCTLYGASAYIFHELLVKLAAILERPLPPPVLQDDLPWGDRYG